MFIHINFYYIIFDYYIRFRSSNFQFPSLKPEAYWGPLPTAKINLILLNSNQRKKKQKKIMSIRQKTVYTQQLCIEQIGLSV